VDWLHATNDLNLTTSNFDSYGNVSFDPCEFTLHTAANAENNDCSKKLACFCDFLNQASHILQIQSASLNAYAFLTKV
jgi:hypothetical protein